MPLLHHALVIFLVAVFPLWDRRETHRLETSRDPRVRLHGYQKTVAWLWAATAMLLATVPLGQLFLPPAPGPFGVAPRPLAVLPIAIGLAGGSLAGVLLARRNEQGRERLARQLEPIAMLLPRTRQERYWFAAMSVSAGICEEIIYRGFLIRYVSALPIGLGLMASLVIAAIIFGIDHGYQGWKGVIGTSVLALVLTALFFLSGALWVPIVVHALLDLRLLALPLPRPAAATEAGASVH